MNKVENQISRMKSMMTYGLTTEGKNNQYKSVEYQRQGADGKTYGIVREGTKFYIKVSDKKNNVLKEDFDYIGGFRNRKDNEYTSYANALKHFDLKMIGLNESVKNGKKIVIESWNPDKKEQLAVESTDRMRREIERQRQIMGNVSVIEENKNYSVNLDEECCGGKSCNKVDSECAKTQKNNIKKSSSKQCKDKKTCGGDPFTQNAEAEMSKMQKNNVKNEYKPVMSESEEVLGWNNNPDYIDTTNGTEVGDDAPFTEGEGTEKEMNNGTVQEGVALHKEGENQNSPEVGTGEIGDDAPFDKQVREGIEDDDVDVEGDDAELDSEDDDFDLDSDDAELDSEDDDFDLDSDDAELDSEDDDFDSDLDFDGDDNEDDIEERLNNIEELVSKIADSLHIDEFEDDELYDDDEEDDIDMDDEEDDIDMDDEEDDDEEPEVFESRNYKKLMMNEDRLDYFGKHPAYRKSPMRLPSSHHQEMNGYEDINDESVKNEQPYGQRIGSGAPFEVDPEEITDAIAESISRNLKKKI